MKILYIGVYKDGTGWGNSALNNILALDSVGVDVVCRAIKLNNKEIELPERIKELEAKEIGGCTHVIQHVLPHMMEYDGRLKNIGFIELEMDGLNYNWRDYLSTMDEVWVPCSDNKFVLEKNGINNSFVVPHTFDISKFQKSYQPILTKDNNFIFYFIGEFTRRKNLSALIRAFHTEFDPSEPAELLIKTSISGMSAEQSKEKIKQFCAEIKNGLKVYPKLENYKPEIILTESLDEEMYFGLHSSCDCIVSPSYGEAWSIPTFEAMGLGKGVIASNTGGFKEYLNYKTGFPISGQQIPCFGMMDTLPDIYTAKEKCFLINQIDLQNCMRDVYENRNLIKERAKNGIEKVYEFSYEKIGNLMKEKLENNG